MNADPVGNLVAYSLALGALLLAAAIRIGQLARSTGLELPAGEQVALTDAELADEEALLAHQLWWRFDWP